MFNIQSFRQLNFATKSTLAATLVFLAGCTTDQQVERITVPIVVTGTKICDAGDVDCQFKNYISNGGAFQFDRIIDGVNHPMQDADEDMNDVEDARVKLRNGIVYYDRTWEPFQHDPKTGEPIPTTMDIRYWQAAVPPGTYKFHVDPTNNLYAKSIRSGATDLLTENLVVSPGVAPPPIEVVLGKAAVVKGVTSRNGKPVVARIFGIRGNEETWGYAVSSNYPDGHGKFTFQLGDLEPGSLRICALTLADVDKLPEGYYNRGISAFCRKFGVSVTVHEGEIRHLNLEVHDVHAADLSPNASN